MKKIECPSCAVEVEAQQDECPICGYEFPKQKKSVQIAAWVMILLVILWLVF